MIIVKVIANSNASFDSVTAAEYDKNETKKSTITVNNKEYITPIILTGRVRYADTVVASINIAHIGKATVANVM